MPQKQKNSSHRLREKNEKPTRAALLDIHGMEPTYDLLNRLMIWNGRIKIVFVKRKGPMLIARTDADAWIVWPTMADLYCFSKSQAIIGEATNITIPTPPQGDIRWMWEQAVDTLLRIAGPESIHLEPALQEEIRDLLDLAWSAALQPQAKTTIEFIDFMRCVKRVRRDPSLKLGPPLSPESPPERIPPVVFIAEESTWVHVPSFRSWLSIPALLNRQPVLTDVRNGLLLLDFTYCKNLHRGCDGDEESLSLWRGPVDSLSD